MRNDEDGGSRLAEIQLGFDRFEPAMIAEACRAGAFGVELNLMDANGTAPGRVALTPHRMLVRNADFEMVTWIVNRSFPLSG